MKLTKKNLHILGIDTSCDETSAAITYKTRVLSNVVSSQVELHSEFGGVVPIIAKREHQARIDPVISEAFKRASKNAGKKIEWKTIDAIAVTYGPGLAIALEVGLLKAKELAKKYNKPLIAVNHMEGHLWSALGSNSEGNGGVDYEKIKLPVLGVLISGGHTELVEVKKFAEYKIIGETLDDAMGEAYDKVARMLGLGYPGGAVLSEMAQKGDANKYTFPIPLSKQNTLNLSFSGLKTAIYYFIKQTEKQDGPLTREQIYNIAAGFERSAISALCIKITMALQTHNVKSVFVGGGVTASKMVRKSIRKTCQIMGVRCHFPSVKYINMDNGAMIAIAGYLRALRGDFASLDIDREPRVTL